MCDDAPYDSVLYYINAFVKTKDTTHLYEALDKFCDKSYGGDRALMILDVSKHFEEGARKYGENNWQKGLPVNCYIDSAIRHYLKYVKGDRDERHDRSLVWNLICCAWEVDYHGTEEN
jgi:hypothetical protein